jgi:glutathione synthase/RimK-type ligase-like ATP-grasp enzyme
VQTLVPPVGHDLRVLVAGGEVVGAEERVAGLGEWRTNISLGGFHRPAVPPPAACELSVAATTAVGAELCGIDLLPADDGYVVIEVNGAVDFTAGYSQPGEDVFERLAVALDLLAPPFMTVVPAVGSRLRAGALTPLQPSGNGRIETMSAER